MTPKMVVAVVVVFVTLAVYCSHTARSQDMNLIDYGCQQNYHETNTNAEQASDEVYNFIRDHASDPGYNTMKVVKAGDDTYFGQVACDGKISQDQCSKCAYVAYDFIITKCAFSNGVHVKFGSCKFRVENYDFDPNW